MNIHDQHGTASVAVIGRVAAPMAWLAALPVALLVTTLSGCQNGPAPPDAVVEAAVAAETAPQPVNCPMGLPPGTQCLGGGATVPAPSTALPFPLAGNRPLACW